MFHSINGSLPCTCWKLPARAYRPLGITQKSAWFLLQRLREACGSKKKDDERNGFLRGIIEADETCIGGKEANKHADKQLHAGRGAVGKMGVLGIRERAGKVTASVIDDTGAFALQSAVRKVVAPGSILCTDELSSYCGMSEYQRHVVNHSAKQFVDGMAHTNSIESVWAVLEPVHDLME